MATFFRPSAFQLDQLLLSFANHPHNFTPLLLRPKSKWLIRKKHTSSPPPPPVLSLYSRKHPSNRAIEMANLGRFEADTQYQNNHNYHNQEEQALIDSSRLRLNKRTESTSSFSSSSSKPSIPIPSSSGHPPNGKCKSTPSNLIRTFLTNLTDRDQADEKSPQLEKAHHQAGTQAPTGLFGRLRQLTKLYGSAALIIYGILGTLDFGLSFLTIYLVGAEHVRRAEDWLLEQLNWKRVHTGQSPPITTNLPSAPSEFHDDNNMLWTTAVVAYTIHKTILLPVRIGLTAWITPPLVRSLRKRGWKIGRNIE